MCRNTSPVLNEEVVANTLISTRPLTSSTFKREAEPEAAFLPADWKREAEAEPEPKAEPKATCSMYKFFCF